MLKDWGATILLGYQVNIRQEVYNLLSDYKKLSKRILITITDGNVDHNEKLLSKEHSGDSVSYTHLTLPTTPYV